MQYEVAAQIFLSSIRGARNHSEFSKLNAINQNAILRENWAAIFVLKAATWPIDLATFDVGPTTVNKSIIKCLSTARMTILKQQLDDVEISCLETFVLCRPGDYLMLFLLIPI